MAWDPTDYKDMLDDDWNDIHQNVIDVFNELEANPEKMAKELAEALRIPSVEVDILDWLANNISDRPIEDDAKEIMDKFYLMPIARKRLRKRTEMKNENKVEDMRAKTVNEGNPYDRPVMGGKIYDPNETKEGGPVAPDEQAAFREAAETLLNKLLDDGWDINDACEMMVETIGEIGENTDFERGGESHE